MIFNFISIKTNQQKSSYPAETYYFYGVRRTCKDQASSTITVQVEISPFPIIIDAFSCGEKINET